MPRALRAAVHPLVPRSLLRVLILAACAALALEGALSASPGPGARATLVPIPPIAPAERHTRRQSLLEAVQKPAVIVIASGLHEGSDDVDREFAENGFFYLTGVEATDTVLVIAGDPAQKDDFEETLFLPPRNPGFEVWNGARLFPGEAAEQKTGIARTAPFSRRDRVALEDTLKRAKERGLELFTLLPLDAVLNGVIEDEKQARDLRPFINRLRVHKSEAEVARLERAAEITGFGLIEAMKELRPQAFEYELEGKLIGTFRSLGSERVGFTCICGSGPNSTSLHYMRNDRQMQDGEVVVLDVGAKFDGYSADVTRTVPVSGKFTPRQREIYEIVLAAQLAAERAVKQGGTLREVHQAAYRSIAEKGYAEYFPHGTSHTLGLDVHDVMVPHLKIEPGVAFTIEPGIYLPREGFGVRIEDDYVYTEHGLVRLSQRVPREVDAVEALVNSLRTEK